MEDIGKLPNSVFGCDVIGFRVFQRLDYGCVWCWGLSLTSMLLMEKVKMTGNFWHICKVGWGIQEVGNWSGVQKVGRGGGRSIRNLSRRIYVCQSFTHNSALLNNCQQMYFWQTCLMRSEYVWNRNHEDDREIVTMWQMWLPHIWEGRLIFKT